MLGAPDSEIGAYRLRNLRAYNAEPVGEFAGPEIEDRSRIVATDARDTVNWMMPGLMKTFLGTDNAVEFTATRQDKEDEAKLITEYINHVFRTKNPGFSIAHQWFMDALREKVGFLKAWWEHKNEDSREDYDALTEDQVAMLNADPNVEMIDAPEMVTQQMVPGPDGQPAPMRLYRVSIKRTERRGRLCIVPCSPEEVRISRRARYSEPVDCIAHVFQKPAYELRDMGYDLEGAAGGMQSVDLSEERLARTPVRLDETDRASSDEMQLHECAELYLRHDFDGDGVTEWRKVLLIDEQMYLNEKVDDHPFVWICPVPMPHTFFGECPVDYAIAPQKLHTQMIRAQVDNINLSVNTRNGVIEGQVNLEDALDSTPGGVVRMKTKDAIFPLVQPDMTQGAARMIEYADEWKENTTGFTRYSQGTDADSLNKTATGVSIITQKADMRMELISRHFAEGFKDLFRKMLKLIIENQDVAEMVKVGGAWVNIDPSQWTDQHEININVGLGTGDRQGQLQKAQMLIQNIMSLMPTGVVTLENLQNAEREFLKALDMPQPERYFQAGQLQPQPPAPNPDQIKAQQAQQAQQQDLQHAAMMAHAEHDAKQMDAERQERIEIAKMQMEFEYRQWEAQLRANVELQKAQITANASIEVASISAQAKGDAEVTKLQGIVATKAQEHAHALMTQANEQRHDALMAEAHHDAAQQTQQNEPDGDRGAD